MKRLIALILMVFFLTGCAASGGSVRVVSGLSAMASRQAPYFRAISHWQDRLGSRQFRLDFLQLRRFRDEVRRRGWSRELVERVLAESRGLTRFVMEADDQWLTPQEFVAGGFQGDCEDIAIFLLAILRSLDYPYQVRILAVKAAFVEHALLKVEMPDHRWQVFETSPTSPPAARLAYTPIVEFNDREILFFPGS